MPALICAAAAKPSLLSVGEQHGGMFRRMQEIDAKFFRRRRGKRTTMGVRQTVRVNFSIRLARAPIHLPPSQPELLDVHGVQHGG